ncbi:uncharacterized [Tachysurus ichikawai]
MTSGGGGDSSGTLLAPPTWTSHASRWKTMVSHVLGHWDGCDRELAEVNDRSNVQPCQVKGKAFSPV